MHKFVQQREHLIQKTDNVHRRGLMNFTSLKAPSNNSLDSPETNSNQTEQKNCHVPELTKRICNLKKSQAKMELLLKNCVGNLKGRLAQESKINKRLEEDVHELGGRINRAKQAIYLLKGWCRDRALSVEQRNSQLYQPRSNSRMTHSKAQQGSSLQTRYGFKSSPRAQYY